MKKYKVVWYDLYCKVETIIYAESKSKANYKLFKSQLGKAFIKKCKFSDFLKYYYSYTEVID